MYVICLDLESVLIPEIWVIIAKATGIQELEVTTRDISDYEELMNRRLKILLSHNLRSKDILKMVETIKPYDGACDFLNWLRKNFPTIILTDSFYELVTPLLEKLGYPTILGNSLEINKQGLIKSYKIRQKDGKAKAVKALKNLKFKTIAIGDSYNDIHMLQNAEIGILFNPSTNIQRTYSNFPVAYSYNELRSKLWAILLNKR